MPKWEVEVVETREYLVTYVVEADTLEAVELSNLACDDVVVAASSELLDDSEVQLFIDKITKIEDEPSLEPIQHDLTQEYYQAEQAFAKEAIHNAKLVAAGPEIHQVIASLDRAFGDSSRKGDRPSELAAAWQLAIGLQKALD